MSHVLNANEGKERAHKLGVAGVRMLPGVARYNRGHQRWLKVAVAAATIFLPSLLSPLFLFSALSSVFFRYLLFFSSVSSWLSVVVEGGGVSGGQVVCCGGGEEARWQLWLFFFSGIFFISSSVTSRSSPLLCWLPFLSSVSPKNTPLL